MPEQAAALVVCALVTAGLCALGPALIARLPEPVADDTHTTRPDRTAGSDAAAGTDADRVSATDPPAGTPLYAQLAERPGLATRLAVFGGLAGAVIGWRLGFQPAVIIWVFVGAVGVLLGYIDAQTRLLPTRIIAPSYGILIALLAVSTLLEGDWSPLIRALMGWAIMGGFYFVMWFVYPKGLGYGDVRLSGLLGMALGYLGWGELATGMYAGFLLGAIGGGLLALVKIVDRKRYPFGPFMLLGALAGLVWGQQFADWYVSW